MITIRRALPVALSLTFVLAACGGSSDSDDAAEVPATAAEAETEETEDFTEAEGSETEATDTEAEADEVEEPVVSEEAAQEPAETEPAETEQEPVVGEAAAGEGIDVALSEWAVTAPTEYAAGEITFNASNGGSFPHEFVVIEGESYESLPLAEGGAVIEEDLPTGALIGRTGRLGGGSSEALTVTLAPGNYVLVCNLGGGNNSHAGQGQRLDITVG